MPAIIVLGLVFSIFFVFTWGETKKSVEEKGGTTPHGGFVLLGLLASIWLSALFLLILKEYAFFFANLIIAIVFTIAAAFVVIFSAPSSNKEDISDSNNYDD
jgi:hypothetical protein